MNEVDDISYILDEQVRDLRSDVKVRIADYFTDLTRHNAQHIDPGMQDTHVDRTRPVTGGGQSEAFASGDGAAQLENISDSGIIFKPTIGSYMKKGVDGHVILPEVSDLRTKARAVYPVSEFLESQPTSPSDPFARPGRGQRTGTRVPVTIGVYDPNVKELTFEQLYDLGTTMLLNATADFQSAGSSGRSTIDRASIGARRFPVSSLSTRNLSDLVPDSRQTFGTQNTPDEPFDSTSSIAMSKLAVEMVEALKVVVASRVSSVGFSTSAGSSQVPAPPPLVPGIHAVQSNGLAVTRNDYSKAVDKGVEIFFGQTNGSNERIEKQPGFYAAVAKATIRLASAAADGQNADRALSVLNVFAAIGDTALQTESLGNDPLISKSNIDTLEDSGVTRVGKSRDRSRSLAWRTSVLPSSYLLPDQIITAYETFTGRQGSDLLAGPAGAKMVLGPGNRISAEHVQRVETLLDSEYVPFYFHDIRTNEIVAFHAFLESMSDSYAVEYEDTSGYGRVDDVMIYSKTKRSISLEFSVVATNHADFDEMWWKINKLTTLLYPQWTEGRKVNASNGKFIQPFSQIPGSSPLIRLRLGDVFKSNYSRFNLARIFGLGTSNFDLGASSAASQVSDSVISVRLRMSLDPATAGFTQGGYKTGEQAYLGPEPTGVGWKAVDGKALPLLTTNNVMVTFSDNGTIVTAANGTPYTLYTVTVSDTEALSAGIEVGPYYVSGHANFTIFDGQVVISAGVSIGDESQSPDQIRSDIQNFFSPDASAIGGGNAIVRSFESTAGKGLAGVITNMNFEWLTATWELGPGQTAPKFCKIKLDFKPIHDIAPGLDSSGFNRAPIYNIGSSVGTIAPDIYKERADSEFRQRSFAADKARTAAA